MHFHIGFEKFFHVLACHVCRNNGNMEEEGQEDRPASRETGQLTSPTNAEKDILVRELIA